MTEIELPSFPSAIPLMLTTLRKNRAYLQKVQSKVQSNHYQAMFA